MTEWPKVRHEVEEGGVCFLGVSIISARQVLAILPLPVMSRRQRFGVVLSLRWDFDLLTLSRPPAPRRSGFSGGGLRFGQSSHKANCGTQIFFHALALSTPAPTPRASTHENNGEPLLSLRCGVRVWGEGCASPASGSARGHGGEGQERWLAVPRFLASPSASMQEQRRKHSPHLTSPPQQAGARTDTV